ncbi:hypothetical protein [Pedobacter metabolipauper]|uniref:Uncharacterized protein n=1 Tax=Pedobacter metabolipauper TaxID=425513 RepID=A0A4R6STP4_9SPHI|nr:hypothetical protein [Pedobacter metabolipauper]TDQ06996.1 hypothetical protein ATK78_4012 [Pedobacter metabolipauper]
MSIFSIHMKTRSLKNTAATLMLAGLSLAVQAQKVTELQEVSIFAPATIKIDGKNIEWGNSVFAENKRTTISYLISNDDKNLYLVVRSTDLANNTKIMAGGITFSVNPDGKKKEKESITLTYPLINRANFRGGQQGRRQGMGGGGGGGIAVVGAQMGAGGGGGVQQTPKQRDSAMAAMQKTQLALVKEIKIKGFKVTTDTLISIYNTSGIKAVANIDKDNAYFYEMAIPLSELGLTVESAKEFAYNIKLNGLQMPDFGGGGGGGGGGFGGGGGGGGGNRGGGGGGFGGGGGGGGNFGPRNSSGIDFQALFSPTDFWGKYTLTKK